MKRLSILLISAFLLVMSLALTSCVQDSVDSMQSDILDKASDYLEPFFKESLSSTADSSTYDEDSTVPSTSNLGDNPDIPKE